MTLTPLSSSLASPDPKARSQHKGDQQDTKKEILQLPAPDPDANVPSLKVGESLKLESVGPVIINSDGTARTIANWDTLTEREKEVSWRRIKKRNAERREALLKAQSEREDNK